MHKVFTLNYSIIKVFFSNITLIVKINTFTTGKISFDQKNSPVQTSQHMQNVLHLYNQKMENFNTNNLPNRYNNNNGNPYNNIQLNPSNI